MSRNNWLPRESLRPYVGRWVEVLAIYGRKRRFIVGLSTDGTLIEISEDNPIGISAESEYATITALTTLEVL